VGSGSARPGLGGEAVMVRITSSGEGGDAYRGSRGATRLVRVRMASFFRGSLGRRGGYGWCSEGGEVGHRSQGRQVQSGPGRVGRRVQVCRGSRGEAREASFGEGGWLRQGSRGKDGLGLARQGNAVQGSLGQDGGRGELMGAS